MLAIVVLVAGCIDDTSRLYIRRKKLLSVFDEVAFRNSRPLHRYPWSHSLLVHFSPLPLLLFSFLFVRWYWISFFRKFDFAKGLIQTNEIYMINKIEDSKFSKNFQSFVPHYSILFFPPSSQRFNLRNNVQTNFSTTQPAKFTRWLRIIFASENICFCVNVSLDVRLSRTLEERSSLFRARAR